MNQFQKEDQAIKKMFTKYLSLIDHLFSATLGFYIHKTVHEHLIDARFYTVSGDKKVIQQFVGKKSLKKACIMFDKWDAVKIKR